MKSVDVEVRCTVMRHADFVSCSLNSWSIDDFFNNGGDATRGV
jgi:hypothetical protein